MINNFIGGGQVFLHKVRMFKQVFFRTIHIAFLLGILAATILHFKELKQLDWQAFYSYHKAELAVSFDQVMNEFRVTIGNKPTHVTFVDAKNGSGISLNKVNPKRVINSTIFKQASKNGIALSLQILVWAGSITFLGLISIILLWSRFGNMLKSERKKEGSAVVLTPKQVRSKLKSLGKASHWNISNMPLVKDMETRHFLVTGSTGSGKTNLIHNILPQVQKKEQPAVIIDQTGEMIAKYYNKERGDIIFNPFDARSSNWDFWADCSSREDVERFSKILIGFNRKQSGSHSDPFWENAAESVFNAAVQYLRPKQASIEQITQMVCSSSASHLRLALADTEAGRYLAADSKQTVGSIVSVLAANAKPLTYLRSNPAESSFSMQQHFRQIKEGSSAWLFLATKPSSRSLTMPLVACLAELALAQLMDIGIDKNRRVWVVLDEIASLGKLPALSPLMAEGRKYGACVIAGMQSLNQLYEQYGYYAGSTIFGQFGTSFFFRNTEPAIAKMVSSMCGYETVTRQQKNTSFGANEFRDGVSYNEQQQKKPLVEPEDLASLAVGECYTLLPEPAVRLSKMQTIEAKIEAKQEGFIPHKAENTKPELDIPAREEQIYAIQEEYDEYEDTTDSEPNDTEAGSKNDKHAEKDGSEFTPF
jgi:type IV conjugative transfer system coupling protein TraD